jgi:hypothetical protein
MEQKITTHNSIINLTNSVEQNKPDIKECMLYIIISLKVGKTNLWC